MARLQAPSFLHARIVPIDLGLFAQYKASWPSLRLLGASLSHRRDTFARMTAADELAGFESAHVDEIPLAPVLFELLVRYVRDQDSDLRLLGLVERASEEAAGRTERLVN